MNWTKQSKLQNLNCICFSATMSAWCCVSQRSTDTVLPIGGSIKPSKLLWSRSEPRIDWTLKDVGREEQTYHTRLTSPSARKCNIFSFYFYAACFPRCRLTFQTLQYYIYNKITVGVQGATIGGQIAFKMAFFFFSFFYIKTFNRKTGCFKITASQRMLHRA